MEVLLFTVKLDAGATPNITAVAPLKFVPLMVTEEPPAVEPVDGLMPVTVLIAGSRLKMLVAVGVGGAGNAAVSVSPFTWEALVTVSE
jgi:hypothetical protein